LDVSTPFTNVPDIAFIPIPPHHIVRLNENGIPGIPPSLPARLKTEVFEEFKKSFDRIP